MCLICIRLFKKKKKKVCISQGDGKQRKEMPFYNIACASAFRAKYNPLTIGGFLYYSFNLLDSARSQSQLSTVCRGAVGGNLDVLRVGPVAVSTSSLKAGSLQHREPMTGEITVVF